MPTILKLTDPMVKEAARHPALDGLKRIGRGAFCAVYDKGDTVVKMTCDPIQYAFTCDAWSPEGPFFPRLVENHFCIGETWKGVPIYLFEVEKLAPVRRDSPAHIKRLARRLIKATADSMWSQASRHRRGSYVNQKRDASMSALQEVIDEGKLPADLLEALQDVHTFVSNYDAMIDFHGKNLMLRGEQLILNDVVADPLQVRALWGKAYL